MCYKISIIGDSISTYDGYNLYGYPVHYKDDILSMNEMSSVDDTWWKQVINYLGGELCVNDAYSGSCVAGKFFPASSSDERCSRLHGKSNPNVILIYMGTNDRSSLIDVGMDAKNDSLRFYGAYRAMLQKLKANYPAAKIVCGTLLMWQMKDDGTIAPESIERENEHYNEAIRRAAQAEGCLVADLAQFGERFETIDYCHPTLNGHKTMANLWIKCLKTLI